MITNESKSFLTVLENSEDKGKDKRFTVIEADNNTAKYKVITVNTPKLEKGFVIEYLE